MTARGPRRLLGLVPVAAFLVVVAALWVGLGRDPRAIPTALEGETAPDFALPPLPPGETGFSRRDLGRGEVTLVNVFASWCGPCRVEHPVLMELARRGIAIYGLNYKDTDRNAARFLDSLGNPYERVGADRDGRVAIDWGVYGVPETFIVDGEGRIRHKHVGPIMPRALETEILPAIERARR